MSEAVPHFRFSDDDSGEQYEIEEVEAAYGDFSEIAWRCRNLVRDGDRVMFDHDGDVLTICRVDALPDDARLEGVRNMYWIRNLSDVDALRRGEDEAFTEIQTSIGKADSLRQEIELLQSKLPGLQRELENLVRRIEELKRNRQEMLDTLAKADILLQLNPIGTERPSK